MFTGDEFGDGGEVIASALSRQHIAASFFLTGRFYRNPAFANVIARLRKDGHYLGAHSDQHLLYCDWEKRDSLLVSRDQFKADLLNNYNAIRPFGIQKRDAMYFLPPYEWYNDSIAAWTRQLQLQLINYTSGTLSHTDYTTPDMKNYRDSKIIYESIINYEAQHRSGLNGFILLVHIGTDPKRTDKFYLRLENLVKELQSKGYEFVRINELLQRR